VYGKEVRASATTGRTNANQPTRLMTYCRLFPLLPADAAVAARPAFGQPKKRETRSGRIRTGLHSKLQRTRYY
jgi:hypothetical protein